MQKKEGMVRSVDLARHMGFSKPSISHAVGVLKNGGFLTVDEDGYLHLTEDEREVAEKIYENILRVRIIDNDLQGSSHRLKAVVSAYDKGKDLFMKTLNDYMSMSYRMEVVEDKTEGGFVVSYPDLPGCITCGETVESAIQMLWMQKSMA